MTTKHDQFMLRLPNGMRSQVSERAKCNMRSMNSEIVLMIARALGQSSEDNTYVAAPEGASDANRGLAQITKVSHVPG